MLLDTELLFVFNAGRYNLLLACRTSAGLNRVAVRLPLITQVWPWFGVGQGNAIMGVVTAGCAGVAACAYRVLAGCEQGLHGWDRGTNDRRVELDE